MTSKNSYYTGLAVVIAWPGTYCKQPGSWYDPITSFLGFSENRYYKAGHAALVLIDKSDPRFHYFDFGRYHAPFNNGRVRSAETDHELEIKLRPELSEDDSTILNYTELLTELQNNISYHGVGKIYASYTELNFQKAYAKALQIQERGAVPYGPFECGGSNCSRFVYSSVKAGKPAIKNRLKLRFLVPLTPTPLSNVRAFSNQIDMHAIANKVAFVPASLPDANYLRTTLDSPQRHPNIPEDAQWLAGEGAGSWFCIKKKKAEFYITRYSPEGKIECNGDFAADNIPTDSNKHIPQITHISHCESVTLLIGKTTFVLKRT